MSDIMPTLLDCPGCGEACSAALFESLNGDLLGAQVEAILDGSFERTRCAACGLAFQPEHQMLFAMHRARLWIVMYPFDARPEHALLEPAVAGVVARSFGEAPGVIAGELEAVRPRLVFGQYALTEAVRSARDAIDPPVLECAKLLAYERSLSQLFALGPIELVYEQRAAADQLVFGVRALGNGERLGELRIASAVLDHGAALRAAFEVSHAELFEQPYVSAVRYLLHAT
jgi:hypothetical protein